MSVLKCHSYDAPGRQGGQRVLEIFASSADFHVELLDEHILQQCAVDGTYFGANLIGGETAVSKASNLLREPTPARERLLRALRDPDNHTRCITYDRETQRHSVRLLCGVKEAHGDKYIALHRNLSLTNIFDQGQGVVRAPRGYHYKKPSGLHSHSFLRASNTLESGINIECFAFWLLPWLQKYAVRRIVVDTSGISSVAVALAHQGVALGLITRLPTVESFGSYGGLSKVHIEDPDHTLFLISASTSGGLARKLTNLGANPNLIVILFYLSESALTQGTALCELKKDSATNPNGLIPFKSFPDHKCPDCAAKSFAIQIEGDQFSLEPPKEELVLITKTDLPSDTRDLLNNLAGIEFFRAHRTAAGRQFEIFLDPAVLFGSIADPIALAFVTKVVNRWRQLVQRGAIVNTARVVHASYPYSTELAKEAANVLHKFGHDVPVLDSRDLRSEQPVVETGSLVIASCLDDAHELMGISRDLRDVQPNGNITYIAPVLRTASRTERDRVVSNLTFGEHGAATFSLFAIQEIELPKSQMPDSWSRELDTLRAIRRWADREGKDVPEALSRRINLLEAGPAHGLVNDLFWPSFKDAPLRLRSDFAFIDAKGGTRAVSQADVFTVMSTILHRLREGVPGKPRLTYRTFERGILSPDNFQRFNDGIVQASIVRASRMHEMGYRNCTDEVNEDFVAFLESQMKNVKTGEGEALPEFLIGIVTGHITLQEPYERRVLDSFLRLSDISPAARLIAEFFVASRSR